MSKKFGIGKILGLRYGEAKKVNLNVKSLKETKFEKSRCSEANKFEFEFKGLEMNKIGNQGEGRTKC